MKTKPSKRNGSLAAIAEARGVSLMTVSRALRGDSRVKDSTRKEILETARELGYHRNPKMGRPRVEENAVRPAVELIFGMIGDIQPWFFAGLLKSVERELARRGRDCVIRICGPDYADFVELTELSWRADWEARLIIGYFEPERLRTLLALSPNVLLVDNPGEAELDTPYGYVAFDNAEAARIGVRHLLGQGRRNILLLRGPSTHYFSREVEQGYREALAQTGVCVNPELILETDFTADGAREAVDRALTEKLPFDGIFTNDEMAAGALQATRAHGVAVPDAVSVVGCDGLPLGRRLYPPLTTVKLDYQELGRIAVETLLGNVKRKGPLTRTRLVPELEIRDSSVVTSNIEGE